MCSLIRIHPFKDVLVWDTLDVWLSKAWRLSMSERCMYKALRLEHPREWMSEGYKEWMSERSEARTVERVKKALFTDRRSDLMSCALFLCYSLLHLVHMRFCGRGACLNDVHFSPSKILIEAQQTHTEFNKNSCSGAEHKTSEFSPVASSALNYSPIELKMAGLLSIYNQNRQIVTAKLL